MFRYTEFTRAVGDYRSLLLRDPRGRGDFVCNYLETVISGIDGEDLSKIIIRMICCMLAALLEVFIYSVYGGGGIRRCSQLFAWCSLVPFCY